MGRTAYHSDSHVLEQEAARYGVASVRDLLEIPGPLRAARQEAQAAFAQGVTHMNPYVAVSRREQSAAWEFGWREAVIGARRKPHKPMQHIRTL